MKICIFICTFDTVLERTRAVIHILIIMINDANNVISGINPIDYGHSVILIIIIIP